MGTAHAKIQLHNPRDPGLAPLKVEALADTGAHLLCIPRHMALQLKLEMLDERPVTTADGATAMCPYVGPIEVRFENRRCFVGALVLGDEVLLGAVPMEDMDLVVNLRTRSVTVNPASPNMPHHKVKAGTVRWASWQ